MGHLAIFYTNNKIDFRVLKASLQCFVNATSHPDVLLETVGVIVSDKTVGGLSHILNKRLKSIIAPTEVLDKGHLSIIEKISLALRLFPAEYVSLHEHDVLYPEEYVSVVQQTMEEINTGFDYLAYNNMLGVNKTGYQQRIVQDYPFSTLVFRFPVLLDLLDKKRDEFFMNKGWCYLEPGYSGSFGGHLQRINLGKGCVKPVVHVNMNDTSYNHHFTNHYLTYERVSQIGFNEWPGDLSYFFD